ncbi:alpha/beta fold hydrolase [Shewanella olleyana]|uniref:alpha/beta fold hydrolase n=1 Tax=Shewanella olleyana TaxID=135626 RepID=UPI0020109495|nr:alpha/beta fold hydrolase [Shewanella olleyana]MCL1065606.1 alpha/beta fold hydrolase [Shewanella olleyana]
MHYVSSGEGQPVILIHGLFGNLDNLKNLASTLEENYQVIRVDLPNHGKSEHWEFMDYPSLAKECVNLLEELNLSEAHFVGHSMGGKVAMALALLHPEMVTSLVVADIAPVSYSPRHQKVFAGLTSMPMAELTSRSAALEHLINADIDLGTAQFLLKNLQRADNGFEWKMNLDGLIENYPHIIGWEMPDAVYSKPCFFIRGGESEYVLAEHTNAIMKQFPKVTAKTINGTGHWLHAQKPEIFNRLVGEFIDKHQS